MSKVVFVDVDGVLANNTERFNKAEEAKQAYLKSQQKIRDGFSSEEKSKSIYWQTAFNPELVALDTLIPGTIEALIAFCVRDYTIILLTSRPESMRQATIEWLIAQNAKVEEGFFTQYEKLIMKEPAFTKNYIKTVPWKVGIIQTFATYLNATEVVVVDDEVANREEVEKYQASYTVRCYASLAEAIKEI